MAETGGAGRGLSRLAETIGRPGVLEHSLAQAVREMQLPPGIREQLGLLAEVTGMTVRDFLRRQHLHRKLEQIGAVGPVLAALESWIERTPPPPPAQAGV